MGHHRYDTIKNFFYSLLFSLYFINIFAMECEPLSKESRAEKTSIWQNSAAEMKDKVLQFHISSWGY